MTARRWHLALLLSFLAILVWSGYYPKDRLIWWLEVFPAMIGAAVLAAIYSRVKLTMLLYSLIWFHALVLMIGGHWTYAEMPLFSWLKETFDHDRNYYDRVGHFVQGFVPAMIAREILLRRTPLAPGGWLFVLVTSVCLAVSACYEFIEWWAALLTGTAATAFLGTQGDPWDAQKDMALAGGGALAAVLVELAEAKRMRVERR